MSSSTDPLANLSPDQQRSLLRQLLQQRAEAAKRFPMSEGQQGLWYAFRRDRSATTFNVFLPSRVRSKLNVGALREAIEYLVDRHPCLRTTFSDAGAELRQQVHAQLTPEFLVIDARELSEDQMRRRVIAETQRPFDLEQGPLLRLAVLQHREDDFVIVATTHHIVVDFWSLILLLSELREAYPSFVGGRTPNLPAAEGNYAAFVQRQQQLLAGAEGKRLWEFWRQTLDGVPTVLDWAADFHRPPNFTGHADVTPLAFAADTAEQIARVAKAAKTTTTAVILAALQVFIYRSTRQRSFLVGSPFSGRGHSMFENTVGFFVNMLPLRADLSDDPKFTTLVSRVGQTLLSSMEHESFPFAQIVRKVAPPRDPSRSPLFQVSCTFEKAHVREESGRAGFLLPSEQEFDFSGLQQESYYIPHPTCHYDVEFIFEQTDDALRGMICYCKDLFDADTAAQMARNFQSLISGLLRSADDNISAATWDVPQPATRLRSAEADQTTLVDLLDSVPRRDPDAIATISDGQMQTYGELTARSRNIARQLALRGIGAGDYVPVAAKPGPAATAAILGVIRAGAAVIPIDAQQPAIPVRDLEDDTAAKLIIVDEPSSWSAEAAAAVITIAELAVDCSREGKSPEPQPPTASDLAYVIYTSGSTGKPKGVMIQHQAIVNTVRWRMDNVPLAATDRVLMLLSHQFDAGFGVTLSCLAQGASVVWADPGATADIDHLISQVVRDRVTVLPSVPSMQRLIVTHPRFKECRQLSQIWCGGESMPTDLPELIWRHCGAAIWNFYGPTEAAVEATAHEVKDQDPRRPIPIGKPIANTEVLILNDQLQPVPDTVPGQLAILGPGLAVGYLQRPELTREKFVPVPGDPQSRMYLTGDLCRRRTDGEIDFLGRIDNQVKLRGYRIELEEIDSVLRWHPAVGNAAVKLIKPDTPAASLAAYVTRTDTSQSDTEFLNSLKRHVAERLPAYKRPTSFSLLDQLPIGSSGKVLRPMLPDPLDQPDDLYVAPSTPLERHLARFWAEMLELDKVGVNQNFFQLGGSSLQAAMMTTTLSEDLGVHVPTALLFDLADVARLSQRLVQLYEVEMAERFGAESVTAYSAAAMPHIHSATGEQSTATATHHPLLAPLKPDGARTPIFMVHPPGGIVICYRELAQQMPEEQPLLAIRSRGLHGREELPATVEAMAADYIEAIKRAQAEGPYVVGGWSLGGIIGYEIAQQLLAAGDEVKRLILLDSTIPAGATDLVDSAEQSNVGLEYGIDMSLDELSELKADDQLPFLWQHAINLGVLSDETPKEVVTQVLRDLKALFHHHVQLTSQYRLQPLDASVLLVRPSDVPFQVQTSRDRGWGKLVREVQVEFVSGHHHSMVQMPQVGQLAELIEQNLTHTQRELA
jgi:amino acid adenylation domain-containing protein